MHPLGQQQNKDMTRTFEPITGYPIDLILLSYVMLSRWFVMMRIHGIFAPTSAPKPPYSTKFICDCKKSEMRQKQEPPNLIRKYIYFLFFVMYSMTIEATTNLVRIGKLPMCNLATIPLTLAMVALLHHQPQEPTRTKKKPTHQPHQDEP